MLKNELLKRTTTINKLMKKEEVLLQKISELEEEKAHILTTNALNTLSPEGANFEIFKRIKELSIYNNELANDKHLLIEQLLDSQRLVEELNQKLSSF